MVFQQNIESNTSQTPMAFVSQNSATPVRSMIPIESSASMMNSKNTLAIQKSNVTGDNSTKVKPSKSKMHLFHRESFRKLQNVYKTKIPDGQSSSKCNLTDTPGPMITDHVTPWEYNPGQANKGPITPGPARDAITNPNHYSASENVKSNHVSGPSVY